MGMQAPAIGRGRLAVAILTSLAVLAADWAILILEGN
jgi:hypothetical protein